MTPLRKPVYPTRTNFQFGNVANQWVRNQFSGPEICMTLVNRANSRGTIVFKLIYDSSNFLENLTETMFVQLNSLKLFTTNGIFDESSCNKADGLNFIFNYQITIKYRLKMVEFKIRYAKNDPSFNKADGLNFMFAGRRYKETKIQMVQFEISYAVNM